MRLSTAAHPGSVSCVPRVGHYLPPVAFGNRGRSGPGRSSLASRLRGWADDATALEQRLKDLETFARSHRRRWVLIAGGGLLALIARIAGAIPTPSGTIVLGCGAFAALRNARARR